MSGHYSLPSTVSEGVVGRGGGGGGQGGAGPGHPTMLRPGFPGGLPGYPPRPGEPGPVRYVYPGQAGPAPPISQPGLQPYSRGEPQPVYVRQPPVSYSTAS